MALYQIYILDMDDGLMSPWEGYFPNDEAAIAEALSFLGKHRVEVREGDRLVARHAGRP